MFALRDSSFSSKEVGLCVDLPAMCLCRRHSVAAMSPPDVWGCALGCGGYVVPVAAPSPPDV
eukprot:1146918-Pyramimonas_sp.AAC.1